MPAESYVKSMTGFGRARYTNGELEIITEIRAVNHRFLDITVRLPRIYNAFEPQVRNIISETASRGKFEVSITRNGGKGNLMEIVLDENLAESYYASLIRLLDKFKLAGPITISDMLTLKEILTPIEKEKAIEEEWAFLEASLKEALTALNEMRAAEGAALWRDIESRIELIDCMADAIAPLVGQVTMAAREKLTKRIQDLTGGLQLDEERLLQETAIIADRSDVTEELIRIKSHLEQFRGFASEGSPVGRKMDFLLQEINREVNTIGSKSISAEISGHVVNMKSELEKIREQVQNIE